MLALSSLILIVVNVVNRSIVTSYIIFSSVQMEKQDIKKPKTVKENCPVDDAEENKSPEKCAAPSPSLTPEQK